MNTEIFIQTLFSFVVILGTEVAAKDFRSWIWDGTLQESRLQGHVMESRTMASPLSCISLCASVDGCETVNFRQLDNTCQLVGADDRWTDVSGPVSDPNFGYYRKLIPNPEEMESTGIEKCHADHVLMDNTCIGAQDEVGLNRSEAQIVCDHKYGKLAELSSPELEGYLDILATPITWTHYWIGITRLSDDSLVWERSNVPVNVNVPPFIPTQPDNHVGGSGPEDCGDASIVGNQFGFNDVPCDMRDRGYICQYDPWVYLAWW